jgi:hypothetical protein
MLGFFSTLAQAVNLNESGDAGSAHTRPMNFSDLQNGFRQWNDNGSPETALFRNGILVVVAIVALIALLVHWRQKRSKPIEPDSDLALGLELRRHIPCGFSGHVMLWWMARSSGIPLGSVLICRAAFDKALETWSGVPTFAILRRWGRSQMERLRPELFGATET